MTTEDFENLCKSIFPEVLSKDNLRYIKFPKGRFICNVNFLDSVVKEVVNDLKEYNIDTSFRHHNDEDIVRTVCITNEDTEL
jgi:hypothetical protein